MTVCYQKVLARVSPRRLTSLPVTSRLLPCLGVEPQGFSDWVEAVCMCPITFHTLSWAIAVHRSTSGSGQQSFDHQLALIHKGKAIRRISSTVVRLETLNRWCRELLVLAMITMAKFDLEIAEALTPTSPIQLKPHPAIVQWMTRFGDLKIVPQHARAALQLVNRLGGIETLQFPGLQFKVS
jgi:hypothetical protein